ncbi:MAG TPA: ABC transporter substrate-binding protein [Methylomirabilota bacterium]|nr:ABC transporter substrate-binding protein [Methylomirabilota bacterium]
MATMAGGLIAAPVAAGAQQTQQRYRVGVVLQGGPFYAMIDGFRDGLKELGFEEGRQYLLHIRDVKGDPKALLETARALEQEKVDVIYSLSTSVTLAVKHATASVPIVFYVGTDPVVVGLVKSYAKPGGRLTGVHSQTTELDSKRLEILKEMFPKLRRVATFYDPGNRAARESARSVREAARQLRIELVERHVASVEELRAGLQALKPGQADGLSKRWAGRRPSTSTGCSWGRARQSCRSRGPTGSSWSSTSRPPKRSASRSRRRSCSGRIR